MRLSRAIVKHRIPIIILAILLMIPAVLGMLGTRINYDMLTYLPKDMDTVIGQDVLLDEFGKGGFCFKVTERKPMQHEKQKCENLQEKDHVETIISYASQAHERIPSEIIPEKIYKEFRTDDSGLVAVFFDTSTSADETLEALAEIRQVAGKQCFVSGLTAMASDLRDLCEREEPIYVLIAVVLATVAMLVFLDGWLVPFIFLASIGMMILLNLGTNYFLGEISYITKALSAVLQLAVTMDYSIFLWHSYSEVKPLCDTKEEAMAQAIHQTFTSVIGSSITTVAGFAALCFMSFTLGMDLGIVMAKGVILGVIGCVTVLPSLILVFDKALERTSHRPLLPNMDKLAKGVIKVFPVFLVIFALLIPPAYYGYSETNDEVYYDLSKCLPDDMDYVIANSKLSENFNIASTHMLLVDSSLSQSEVSAMCSEMEKVDGVEYVLGLESVIGSAVPEEILPDSIKSILESDKHELILINSAYASASDEVGVQLNELNSILKRYDESGMLIGEASCMNDMITTTSHDFQVVNIISIAAIFIIILLVEKSVSLPFILIAVIELGIFINLGLPHYLGQSLPFIAPICISTIQLGATVDYAILMTTRYKAERIGGADKRSAVTTALSTSIPSIIVSGMGLFAATFGVALYSDIDIISSLCMLMARGAVISLLCVIFILPALLMLTDGIIIRSTLGMKSCKNTAKLKEENK